MVKACKDCREAFAVDDLEQQWCRDKGISAPRRCLNCRASRRGFVDRKINCARCGNDFDFTAQLAVLVQTFAWTEPSRCAGGCDAAALKNLRGERKKLAELHKRLITPPDKPLRVPGSGAERPTRPEDLFKGLDALLEKAAAEAAAEAEPEPEPEAAELGFSPKAAPGENVPSPEELFSGLEDRRKSKG